MGESGGGGSRGGGAKGEGGRGHFIHLAIYCTTTWCFALKGLRTMSDTCQNKPPFPTTLPNLAVRNTVSTARKKTHKQKEIDVFFARPNLWTKFPSAATAT